MDEKQNRGRSAEARDPNRPVDPVTGEKVGLGPRGGTADQQDQRDDTAEQPDVEVDVEVDEETPTP